jgi:hypothetical protein
MMPYTRPPTDPIAILPQRTARSALVAPDRGNPCCADTILTETAPVSLTVTVRVPPAAYPSSSPRLRSVTIVLAAM